MQGQRFAAVVELEQWPFGQSPLRWCGHTHRLEEAAVRCGRRLERQAEHVKRVEIAWASGIIR